MSTPKKDEEQEREEAAYERGSRMAWTMMLHQCILHLGVTQDMSREVLLLERERAISTLRDVCTEYGDNDWPDNLHLSDIIDKHLARHLHDD